MAVVLCAVLIWSTYRSPTVDDDVRWSDPVPTPSPVRLRHPFREHQGDSYVVLPPRAPNAFETFRDDVQLDQIRPTATPSPEVRIDDSFVDPGGDIDIDIDRVFAEPADERARVIP